jgi:hypothetical protein
LGNYWLEHWWYSCFICMRASPTLFIWFESYLDEHDVVFIFQLRILFLCFLSSYNTSL